MKIALWVWVIFLTLIIPFSIHTWAALAPMMILTGIVLGMLPKLFPKKLTHFAQLAGYRRVIRPAWPMDWKVR
jgi:hypothetical protein